MQRWWYVTLKLTREAESSDKWVHEVYIPDGDMIPLGADLAQRLGRRPGLTESLNALGREGWELVASNVEADEANWYFKRPRGEDKLDTASFRFALA